MTASEHEHTAHSEGPVEYANEFWIDCDGEEFARQSFTEQELMTADHDLVADWFNSQINAHMKSAHQ